MAITTLGLLTIAVCARLISRHPPASEWKYFEQRNNVGGTDYYASILSTNRVHQRPPYEAETSMEMIVGSTSTSRADVTLEVSSGQLMCPSFAGCQGTVRFDDGPEQSVTFEGFVENRTNTMFLHNPMPFITALKRANHITIAKTMLGSGTQRFHFDVAGLRWEH